MTSPLPMPTTADLRRRLAEILAWWQEAKTTYEDPLPLGVIIHGELKALAKDLAIATRDLEADLYDAMGEKRVEIEGLGVLERSRAANRESYESEALFAEVLKRATIDGATGEMLVDAKARERIAAALKLALPITPSLGWRKKGLTEVVGEEFWRDRHTSEPGYKQVRIL